LFISIILLLILTQPLTITIPIITTPNDVPTKPVEIVLAVLSIL